MLLKHVNACFVCFAEKCPNKEPCSSCGSEKHHVLLCRSEKEKEIKKKKKSSDKK